jgi:hypothetical protein
MGMRKMAIAALLAIATRVPLDQGLAFAQGAPTAMASPAMASSLSQADKDALMKKLEESEEARQGRTRRVVAGTADAGRLRQKDRRDQGFGSKAQKGRGFSAERRRQSCRLAGNRAVLKFHRNRSEDGPHRGPSSTYC